MSQWQVLDLGGDPTPGDPDRTQALAQRLLDQAELVDSNTSRLRSVTGGSDALHMAGDYAPKFRDILSELPGELTKLTTAYRRCGQALSTFATSLSDAKSKAGNALRQGQDAHDTIQGSMRQVQALLPPQTTLSERQVVSQPLLEAAIASLDENIKAQVRPIARRAQFAEQDRQRARQLAQDAARLRGEAEERCADGVRDALDGSGIKNKSWWEKAWDFVSAPFRSWDAFIELCRNIAMVAGIVALFISGPIGLALVAVALVAGAVVFADTLSKFARGEAGLGALALDALGLIPGARGVTSLARLGRSAAGLARGGKALLGGLRSGGIRTGITSLRRSGVAQKAKALCGDPIDVATGDMVQQQTDVDLPGILPLTLIRTHLSSYRVGRWFGPSWASTLDQRLEVDAIGICYTADDGMVLVYPTPGEYPAMPEEGPRRPLRAISGGGYTIEELDRGHTLHFASLPNTDPLVLPLVGITDCNNNRIDLNYDSEGILTDIQHSGGYHVIVDTHDGLITALRLRDGDNGSDVTLIRYRYNNAQRLTEVINSSNLPLRFDYDLDGRITRWTDRNNTWYAYTYDNFGRCVRTAGTDGYLNGVIDYQHDDPDHAVTAVTNSLGCVTRFELNDAYQVIRETNPLGHATTSERDRYDRLLRRTDALGRTTRYTHDLAGNLVALARPDGSQALAEYNNLRLPITVTGPDGAVWHQRYDERGNLTILTDPIGATTHFTYNARGHLTTVIDALGHAQQIITNPAGLPVTITDALGAVTQYDRDAFGRVTAVTDPVGGVTRLGYTVEGKLAWHTLPDGTTESWTYDGEGNLLEHIDALNQPTSFTYTPFDLPATQIKPDGTRIEFTYDSELHLITVSSPQGLTWHYDYDQAGNLIREKDYNKRTLTYTPDAAGQLTERTNGTGQLTRYTRDLLGNIIEWRSEESVTTFAYDAAGRVIGATNPDASVTFQRDPLGRVLAETCNGRTLTNTYDLLGRRLTRRTPSGVESIWNYDSNHQPVRLHTAGHTLRFTHDPAGREVERHLSTNATLAQSWDANHRLVSQTLTANRPDHGHPTRTPHTRLVQRRSYGYRPDGYITTIDDHLIGARHFTLSPAGRITTVRAAGWTEHYGYDAAGNITSAAWPESAQAGDIFAQEGQGERAYSGTLVLRVGDIRYQYDGQGRIAMRQQKLLSAKPRIWHYTWNADDRLVGVDTPNGEHWRYRYDALGRRITKQRLAADEQTVAEQTTFTWDGPVLAEETAVTGPDSSALSITWEWGPDSFLPLTQMGHSSSQDAPQEWIDEQFYAIVTDLIGTPTEMVSSDGSLVWRPRTTLWGRTVDDSSDVATCPLRFPGHYHDSETGFNYNYHRYYDPTSGRYGSSDPLGLAAGSNPHTYVPNPTIWLDPYGLTPCIKNANFAQTTYRESFSAGGRFAGKKIDDVAGELRTGKLTTKDVPIDMIEREGSTLILNTRSAHALERAGIPRSEWSTIDRTGNPAHEARLTGQLSRNDLTSTGTPTARSTG